MWRSPVTFGRGSIITKVVSPGFASAGGVKKPDRSHQSYSSGSTTDGRKFFPLSSSTALGGLVRSVMSVASFSVFGKQKAPFVPGRTAPSYHPGFARPRRASLGLYRGQRSGSRATSLPPSGRGALPAGDAPSLSVRVRSSLGL